MSFGNGLTYHYHNINLILTYMTTITTNVYTVLHNDNIPWIYYNVRTIKILLHWGNGLVKLWNNLELFCTNNTSQVNHLELELCTFKLGDFANVEEYLAQPISKINTHNWVASGEDELDYISILRTRVWELCTQLFMIIVSS